MKLIFRTFLSFSLICLCASACVKDDGGNGSGGDPPASFHVTFYFSDSLGNNVLPYNLPENPIVDPESFYAYSDRVDDIGRYTRSEVNGYYFEIDELIYTIKNDTAGWQQDSIIYFYPCFGQDCDTIKIYKTNIGSGPVNDNNSEWHHCSAQWISYQSDTLDTPYCRIIPVVTN